MEQMHSPNTLQNYNLNNVQYFENHTKPLVPKTNRKMNIFYERRKKGCLFILFVTLKSPKPQHLLLLCSRYGWKVMNE